jgi:hypothetical protein
MSKESFWTSATVASYFANQNKTDFFWDSTATYLSEFGFSYWAENEPTEERDENCVEYSAPLNTFGTTIFETFRDSSYLENV